MTTKARATIDDLYNVAENAKSEIADGEIILMSPTGDMPSRASGSIYISLRQHEGKTPERAYGDNVGFRVNLPNRESFSPDAAWYLGRPTGMKFLEGAPIFAVEVRSENDYGENAEEAMAKKRADYFAAGTLVDCLMKIRFYFDEDAMDDDPVHALRIRGVDVTSALEQGMVRRPDAEHLEFAASQGCAVHSFNIRDFSSFTLNI
jgi:hypothetical protein